MAYKDVVLNDSPEAYWRCEETSGTTLSDETSNGNSASLSGSYDLTANGLISGGGSAWESLDGQAEANFGTALSNLSTCYFELWLEPKDLSHSSGSWEPLMDAGAAGTGLELAVSGNGYVRLYQSGDVVKVTSTTQMSTGTTYHIVGGSDKSGGTLELYINATREDSALISGDATGGNEGAFGDTGGSRPAEGFNDTVVGTAVLGIYDEVAAYTSPLTSTQVQDHYDAGTGSTTVTVSEAAALATQASLQTTDTALTGESAALSATGTPTATDTATATEQAGLSSSVTLSATENATAIEQAALSSTATLDASENATVTEAASLAATATWSITETVGSAVTEAATLAVTTSLSATETATATESAQVSSQVTLAAQEAATASEALRLETEARLDAQEAITVTEAAQIQVEAALDLIEEGTTTEAVKIAAVATWSVTETAGKLITGRISEVGRNTVELLSRPFNQTERKDG